MCFGLEKKIKKLEKFLRHIIRKLKLLCSKNEVLKVLKALSEYIAMVFSKDNNDE